MQQIQANNFGVLNHDEIIDIGEVNNILQQLLLGSELKIQDVRTSFPPYIIVKHNDFEWVIKISKSLCHTV